MANLRKWFPFNFKRKKDRQRESEERQQRQDRQPEPASDEPRSAIRRTPTHESSASRDPNQMFRSFLGGADDWFLPHLSTANAPGWFGNYSPERFSPSIDVTNEADHVVISAELPGISPEDIEVTYEDGMLVLTGEKRHATHDEEDGCFRTERFYGMFRRSIPVPAGVDVEGAEARFDHGVLTVRFRKVEREPRMRRSIELG